MKIGIIGGGISGLTAALFLSQKKNIDVTIFEKEKIPGGLCRTFFHQGFGFDIGGHILFSKNETTLKEMVNLLGSNVEKRKRNAKVFVNGKILKYPFENDLAGLDVNDRYECLMNYLDNPYAKINPRNFKEWIYKSFGKGIAEKYLIPYNQKIWKVDPEDLDAKWIGRIPKPPLEDVVKSALGINTEGLLHQLYYYYPKTGGYESIIKTILEKLSQRKNVLIKTQVEIEQISRTGNTWCVKCGKNDPECFDRLITTIPPQEMMKVLVNVPNGIRGAVKNLKYNSLILVMLGYKQKVMTDVLSFNIPDKDFLSHRVCFPMSFSKAMGPKGMGGVTAEITVPAKDNLWNKPDNYFVKEVVKWLDKNMMAKKSNLVMKKVSRTKYAYVVCDSKYEVSQKKYVEYMYKTDILPLGRFGSFRYLNSDVCFAEAKALASTLLKNT